MQLGVREDQSPGRGVYGLRRIDATAEVEDVDIERSRPPSNVAAASGITLELLQEAQEPGRRDRASRAYDGIAKGRLPDKTERTCRDDEGSAYDVQSRCSQLFQASADGLVGTAPPASHIGSDPKDDGGGLRRMNIRRVVHHVDYVSNFTECVK